MKVLSILGAIILVIALLGVLALVCGAVAAMYLSACEDCPHKEECLKRVEEGKPTICSSLNGSDNLVMP